MRYIIYVVGVMVFFGLLVVNSFGLIQFSNWIYFLNYPIIFFMLFICVLALYCTKLFKPFGQAFLFVLGKAQLSKSDCERSLLAIKTVTTVSVLFGILLGVIEMIDTIQNLVDLNMLVYYIAWAILPILYAVLICILLLPVQVALKKHVLSKK